MLIQRLFRFFVPKAVVAMALLGISGSQAGWVVNDKRVERIWRQEGLKVPAKQPKKGRFWLADGSCIRLRAELSIKPCTNGDSFIAVAWCIIRTGGLNMSASATPSAWPKRASSPPSAALEIPMTMLSPRPSTASTKARSSIGAGHGVAPCFAPEAELKGSSAVLGFPTRRTVMLRLLALVGGAYALYRRFQGSRHSNKPQYRPTAGPVADQAADAPAKPAAKSATAKRKTKAGA